MNIDKLAHKAPRLSLKLRVIQMAIFLTTVATGILGLLQMAVCVV